MTLRRNCFVCRSAHGTYSSGGFAAVAAVSLSPMQLQIAVETNVSACAANSVGAPNASVPSRSVPLLLLD